MRKKHAMSFGKTLLAHQVLIILHLFVTKLRCILFPIPYQIATLYLGRGGGGCEEGCCNRYSFRVLRYFCQNTYLSMKKYYFKIFSCRRKTVRVWLRGRGGEGGVFNSPQPSP